MTVDIEKLKKSGKLCARFKAALSLNEPPKDENKLSYAFLMHAAPNGIMGDEWTYRDQQGQAVDGVKIHSQIGDIYSVAASLKGLESVVEDDRVQYASIRGPWE